MSPPEEKGVYALIIKAKHDTEVTAGSLGPVKLASGYYVYVGSALGPGGLKARISRHLNRSKKLKWHIDYLLSHSSAEIVGVICAVTNKRYECRIVHELLKHGAYAPVRKFGATDCREKCPAHLLKHDKPISEIIIDILKVWSRFELKPLIYDYGYSTLIDVK